MSAFRLVVGSGTEEFSLLIFSNYKLIMMTFVFVVLRIIWKTQLASKGSRTSEKRNPVETKKKSH